MMSSIVKTCTIVMLIATSSSCSLLTANPPCILRGPFEPAPQWINKTFFELNMSDRFYYGKGNGETRKNAITQSYGDIARTVSVKIFSRQVTQHINEEMRTEAINKAISDVEAKGIEIIGAWQNPTSCRFYVMSRVAKKIAAHWKKIAQSHLTNRPGLGLVEHE